MWNAQIKNDLQLTYDHYTILAETIMDHFKHEQQIISPNEMIRLGRISQFLIDFNTVLIQNRMKAMDLQRLLSRIRYTMESYYRLIDEKNIEGILSRMEVIYDEEFWHFFAYFHAYDRLSDRRFIRLIKRNAIKLCTILKDHDLVSYYDYPLTIYLQDNTDILVNLILHNAELFLPLSLTHEKVVALIERRIAKASYRQLVDYLQLDLGDEVKESVMDTIIHRFYEDYRHSFVNFSEVSNGLLWDDLAAFCGYDYKKHVMNMTSVYHQYADVETELTHGDRQIINDEICLKLCMRMDNRLEMFKVFLNDHSISLEQFASYLINHAITTCHFPMPEVNLDADDDACAILFKTLSRLMHYEGTHTYYDMFYNEEMKVVSYLLFDMSSPLAIEGESFYDIMMTKDMNFYNYNRTQKTYLNYLIHNHYVKHKGIYEPETDILKLFKQLYDEKGFYIDNTASPAFRFLKEHQLVKENHRLIHSSEEGYFMMLLHYLTQRDQEGLYDYAVLMHMVMLLLCRLYDDTSH